MKKALELDKNVAIAVLDSSGNIILIVRGDNVGIHNTEAARRKATKHYQPKLQHSNYYKKQIVIH